VGVHQVGENLAGRRLEGRGYFVASLGEESEEELAFVLERGVEEGTALDDAALFVGDVDCEGEAGGKAASAAVCAWEELVDVEWGKSLAALVGRGDLVASGPGVVDKVGQPVEYRAGVFEVVYLGAGDEALVEADDAMLSVEGEGGEGVVVDRALYDGVEVRENVCQIGGGVCVEADSAGVREAGKGVGDFD